MVKVQLTDEDLTQRKGNYFDQGVHLVVISDAVRGETNTGKEYVEFTVKGLNDEEGTARLWFTTENSCKYALSILAGIAVHNKDTEAEKQKVRDAFKKITDTDQVDDKFLEKFVDMEAWYQVSMSDRTYVNQSGETKNSYDKNIYGYQPKPKQQTAEQLVAEFEEAKKSSNNDEVPFE